MRKAAGLIIAFAATAAHAQMSGMTPGTPTDAAPFGSPVDDQRVFVHASLDQLEVRGFGDSADLRWMGEGWIGDDSDRLWIKSEGLTGRDGHVTDGQQELLYDRPISPYFDLQAGARYDLDSRPGRRWAALGVEGLAPYGVHISATGYFSSGDHAAARLEASYDLLLTQRLILSPEIETNLYSRADPARRTGAGISDLDAGLRLRYEITRKFAPYLGLSQQSAFGGTARLVRLSGDATQSLKAVVGLRTWF